MNETQNICFWLKEVVTHLIKNSDMAEKEHWWREESITAYPKEEDPISEDSNKTITEDRNKNPFNEKPKEDPY